jgi:hypothetical protein
MPTDTRADKPASLGPHEVEAERLALIRQHVALLSETALKVGDMLPLEASAADMIAVLEAKRERRS